MHKHHDPLPMEAMKYCPKCGCNDFVHEEVNSLRCSGCGYHHFFNAAGAVIGIIRNEKGEVLVTRRAFEPYRGMLDLPGGFIMPDETAEEAVKRELYEELRLEVTDMKFLYTRPNRYPFSGVIVYTIDLVFDVNVKDISNLKPGDDVVGCQFVGKAQINSELLEIQYIREIIEKYFEDN